MTKLADRLPEPLTVPILIDRSLIRGVTGNFAATAGDVSARETVTDINTSRRGTHGDRPARRYDQSESRPTQSMRREEIRTVSNFPRIKSNTTAMQWQEPGFQGCVRPHPKYYRRNVHSCTLNVQPNRDSEQRQRSLQRWVSGA